MIALVKTAAGAGNLEIRDLLVPEIRSGEVLIQVKAAGICGSDLHILNWDTQVPMNPPVAIGHEFSGVIAEKAEGIEDWQIGDRVTAEPTFSVCGTCLYCRMGFYNLCPERKVSGLWADGAFAQFVRVPARRLHRLPDRVSFEEGAMTEPLACCVHGVIELTCVSPGDLVVVSGPGAIGLMSMQVAKLAGATVILTGAAADAERLEAGEKLGADRIVNLEEEDPQEVVWEVSGGIGADVGIECSGSQAAAGMGINIVRKRGKYTQIGLFGRPITLDFEKIAYKEVQVTGSFAQKWSAWKKALSFMNRQEVSLRPLISDVVPLSSWTAAFEKMNRKRGIKLLLKP